MDPEPPSAVDVSRPSVARMVLRSLSRCGKHNYPADRAAVAAVIDAYPKTIDVIVEARHFLRRTVRYMCFQGIDQFIDMGSGLPSADNTHQVAQRVNPNARVVYVDIDEAAVTFRRQMLSGDPTTAFIQGSVLELEPILNHEETRKLIDFSKPVGVLMMGLLHFFSVDTDQAILKDLQDILAPGSLLSFSHMSVVEQIMEGYSVIEPGLVLMHEWKMDIAEEGEPEAPQTSIMVGVVLCT
ncbi:S-adenosyl-L-methionine dependent methyltransferase [Trichoderma asperelloides]|nr:S-adenosyl-L-methionine dependent methyltransferase [Trichoderma asperelloides]